MQDQLEKYMHKVNKNWEYKQQKFPNSSDIHNQDVNKFSDVLIGLFKNTFL